MRERPILFSGPMVQAVLEDRKTQTRRVIKPKFNFPIVAIRECGSLEETTQYWQVDYQNKQGDIRTDYISCPYGQSEDRLWVRETFWNESAHDPETGKRIEDDIWYRADLLPDNEALDAKWKPSIFMPRWASRITLEIVNVQVERVQEISEEDAHKEGCYHGNQRDGMFTARHAYQKLWNEINAKRGFGWDANPWVWVITFRRIP